MCIRDSLIDMFKHDFEFVDGHQSHLGHTATKTEDSVNSENKEIKIVRKELSGLNLVELN